MDLFAQALRLAERFPPGRLDAAAVAWANRSAAKCEPWFVSFSGGADSLALLLLVWAHWPAQRARLTALHFNHCLRGVESEADAAFCRDLSQRLGLACREGRWDMAPKVANEESARRARFAWIESVIPTVPEAALFLGHQQDDIVETQLMRLARGASSAGLAAPRPLRHSGFATLVRPLLSIPKADLCAALADLGLAWREDSTNAGNAYLRNRIRQSVVPTWFEATGRHGLAGAALTRAWLEEESEALEAWVTELGIPESPQSLELFRLAGRPRALWRRALHRWRPAASLSRAAFDELLTRCEQGMNGRFSVGNGHAEINAGVLIWREARADQEPWAARSLPCGAMLVLPDAATLRAETIPVNPALWAQFAAGEVDPSHRAYVAAAVGPLQVRPWTAGDRYRPLGAPGSAKLQDLFTNRKVVPELRRVLPVVCDAEGKIVWVPGFPPAERCKLTDVSVTAVQLTYLPGTSTVPHHS